MNIVAADSLVEVAITDLLTEHAPEIEIRSPLGPFQGVYAIDRAREVIGWTPQHSWRNPSEARPDRTVRTTSPAAS